MVSLKKTLVSVGMAWAVVLGGTSAAVAADVITARLSQALPDEHPQGAAMVKFAELVKNYSNGRIQVTVYNNAVLGNDEKTLMATASGTQEFYMGTLAPLAGRVKEVQVWDLPFAFQNIDEVYDVLNGPIVATLFEKIDPLGLEGLMYTGMGFRDLSNNRRPVKTADDLVGLKVRVMQNQTALKTWKAMGVNAVPMAFAEVFTALETKALDGQENPPMHMLANKMYEVQKYLTLTNHVFTPSALVASKKFMDSLSKEDQAIIRRAAKETAVIQRELNEVSDKDAILKLQEKGMTVDTMPQAELDKVRGKVAPVIAEYTAVIGEDFVKIFYAEIEKSRNGRKK